MKKHLLFILSAWITGTMGFGQELIQNGDFALPDDGMVYQRVDSIPGWLTDDPEPNSGREMIEGNGVGWHWDGTSSIYQVVGTVPSVETQFDISLDATCFYSYWSGDYITDAYVILSAFAGEDTLTRIPLDTFVFQVSCISDDYLTWITKTGVIELAAGNEHAGENLVVEIDIFNSRDFGYDESWTYLYYDNVSVMATLASSVKDLNSRDIKMVTAPGMIRILGDKDIESAVIYDISGKRVLEIRPNTSHVTMNVGHLNRGIYIVSVMMNGERYTRKVIL